MAKKKGTRRRVAPRKAKAGAAGRRKSPSRNTNGSGRLEQRLAQALEQQAATSEILKVISRSPADLQPVMDAVAESAARLCNAADAIVWQRDRDRAKVVASHGNLPMSRRDLMISRQSVGGRSIIERRAIHVADLADVLEKEFPDSRGMNELGYRTILAMPLLRESEAIGFILIRRTEVRPFSDAQVALLETFADQAVIAIENARLFRELDSRNNELTESLEQQTATGEVLRVISSSPTDVYPVFETIVASAARLCDAEFSAVARLDDGLLHLVALNNISTEESAAWHQLFPRLPERGFIMGRTFLDGRAIHIEDVLADPDYDVRTQESILRLTGYRTFLGVPIVRNGVPVGVIGCGRRDVNPFTPTQIGLVKTFAEQAVIAIENVRLFTELGARNRDLTETLEQQTATSDILRVISGSPTNVKPVFDSIVQSARGLCGADSAGVLRYEGELLHIEALDNAKPEQASALRNAYPMPANRSHASGRAIMTGLPAHIPDVREDPEYSLDSLRDTVGLRSVLSVPMVRDGIPLGAITVQRWGAPRPFSDKQIAILMTFASQAVIAIENVRLFTELEARNRALTETLDQQTATGEILRVISQSQTDVQPVFDNIVRSAVRLCDGLFSALFRYDGELIHQVAQHNFTPEALEEVRRIYPARPSRAHGSARAILERAVVHIPDVARDADYLHQELTRAVGFRSGLFVPMLRDGEPIGVIMVARAEPGPFSDSEVELLKTFADQAVIAVENVRLFTQLEVRNRDLTETLEQQTATSEILSVISSSPTDVQPVFDTIASNARRLCNADSGSVFTYDGTLMHLQSLDNTSPERSDALRRVYPLVPTLETVGGRAILTRQPVHISDVRDDPTYVLPTLQDAGLRSVLSVPMLRDGLPVGIIIVHTWDTPRPFTRTQIDLLKTFADQAVIAIQNVRLFNELDVRNRDLTETLEQQTATGEILRVISSSPTDIQPVLDTVAESAARLCESFDAAIWRQDGDRLLLVAHHGPILVGPIGEFSLPLIRGTVAGRSVLDGRSVHIADAQTEVDEFPASSENARHMGFRTILSVPLMRKGVAIGSIQIRRTEVQLFTERQVALLETFADQAVIAIENVRLFTELEVRNRDLVETLEQQTATGEILRVISSSPTDVQPVFDTIAQNARALCGADSATVLRYDGNLIQLESLHNANPERADALRHAYPMPATRGNATGRAILTGRPVHIPDVREDPQYALDALRDTVGLRSLLSVPMVRDGIPIGAITVQRWGTPRPFSDKQIELLKTFADQAVIAIENVRLFKELDARNRDLTETLEQQTATGEILRVISGSPTDVQPVFDTILRNAVRLCAARFALVYRLEGETVQLVAHHNFPPGALERFQRTFSHRLSDGGTIAALAMIRAAVVHVPDIETHPGVSSPARELARQSGYRSVLAVPIMRDGNAVGAIAVTRSDATGAPNPFSDTEIALLRTFTEQAVIAIENVRLFHELEVRNHDLTETLEQQTATSEILRVISSSPTDVQPVFDAIARSAKRLCQGEFAWVFKFDGQLLHVVAHEGLSPAAVNILHQAFPRAADRGTAAGCSVLTGAVTEIPDVHADDDFALGGVATGMNFRSVVAVPVLRDGLPIGAIAVARSHPGPFSSRLTDLLKTFADQAVIAIENIRLFQELEARTEDLTRSVGELQALGEVSQAVSSTLDLETVLATVVSHAVQLSRSDGGVVYEFDEATQSFHARATHQITAEHLKALRAAPIRLGEGAIGHAGVIREPVQIADIQSERELVAPQARDHLIGQGMRSLLAMPLIREDRLLGGLVITRREVGAFSPGVVTTLQTFADQSVLAFQNARLFREIQRQKQYSEMLVETSPVAIATMDLHGAVVGWNPGAERLFGYSQTEALGRQMEDLVGTPEIRDAVRANIRQTLEGEWIRAIAQRARKDGTLVDVEISSMPVVVEGARVGMIGIYHDISELLSARREAEAANDAKSAFLATMSHEIRTPMNAVIGMSGLLLNTALTEEQRDYAEIVRQSGDTLLTVINDILDFSKIEAGRLELEAHPFDVRECIESALDLVATRAAEKGIDLAYLIGDGTPPAIVGDVTRLRQVLLNLLSNAVKFTEAGEVVLSVTAQRRTGRARLHDLTFIVRDTGIGIPRDRLDRLFQSFSQVDASTTRRYGGTGLGLAISQRLTELMGGRISVSSQVGVGSEFRFTIRAPAAQSPLPARRDLSGVQPSLRAKRVLVVDDNATNRRILTAHLEAWGTVARATESPIEALAWVRGGERFDVGILDMHMPEMDGVTLAQTIRERPEGTSLPLVLFTSLGRREARAEEAGFAAYLNKPIKPSQLFDALVSVLAEQPVHVPQRRATPSELDPAMGARHPLRILLAEDNVVNQKVALRLLGQMGYRADVAANGLEAIEAVERQTYDVVLMDVQMPELDGFEASREINRRWPGEQRPRLVAMTANALEGDRELCMAAGMDDYVAKPIRVEELVAALDRSRPRGDAGSRAPSDPGRAPAPAGAGAPGPPGSIDRATFDRLTATMDAAFVAELIDTFVEDAGALIATIRRAMAAADRDAFRRAAHSLKSTSESLGAAGLADLARDLETLGRSGVLSDVGDRIERLAAQYDLVRRDLGALRHGLAR